MHSPRDRSADAERAEGDAGQLFYGRSAKCRRGRIAAGLLLGDAGRGWMVERLARAACTRARASVIAGGEVKGEGELPRSAFDRGRVSPPPRNFFRISSPAPLCEPPTMARALQFGGDFRLMCARTSTSVLGTAADACSARSRSRVATVIARVHAHARFNALSINTGVHRAL